MFTVFPSCARHKNKDQKVAKTLVLFSEEQDNKESMWICKWLQSLSNSTISIYRFALVQPLVGVSSIRRISEFRSDLSSCGHMMNNNLIIREKLSSFPCAMTLMELFCVTKFLPDLKSTLSYSPFHLLCTVKWKHRTLFLDNQVTAFRDLSKCLVRKLAISFEMFSSL